MKYFKFTGYFSTTLLLVLSGGVHATEYWVATTGSDAANCLTKDTACATINHVVRDIATLPGDVVNIVEGTYTETTNTNGEFFNIPVMVNAVNSGTLVDPIVIQAAPGNTGDVILDGEGARIPMLVSDNDYITIKGLQFHNANTLSLVSRGKTARIASEGEWSRGVRVEGNVFFNTNSTSTSSNTASIKCDNSRDWVIFNNIIDTSTINGLVHPSANGIQGFNLWNNYIANNHISNTSSGILWKDHNVESDDGAGNITYHEGATYEFNIFSNVVRGISIINKGLTEEEASNHVIRNNIFYDFQDFGVFVNMSDSLHEGHGLVMEHNLFDGTGGDAGSICVTNDAMRATETRGNIFFNCQKYAIHMKYENETPDGEVPDGSEVKYPTLVASDYNVFSGPFQMGIDIGSSSQIDIKTFAEWQATLGAPYVTLEVDNPDANSIETAMDSLFTDATVNNYTYLETSPAIDAVVKQPGSIVVNAGPYILGTEVIGPDLDLVFNRPSPPKPVKGVTFSR